MKKYTSWLLAFVLIFGAKNVFSAQFLSGDLAPRGAPDGILNVADVLVLQRFINGYETPTPTELVIADLAPLNNPNGALDVADVLILERAIHGDVALGEVFILPPAPILDAVITPTSQNPFPISGSATPGGSVTIYVNGLQQHQAVAGVDGRFVVEVYLYDGVNVVHATETDGVDESNSSNILQLEYQNTLNRSQGEPITGNTVWTPGVPNRPYTITRNLSVVSGATLTIMPGTIVQFDNNVTLYARGSASYEGNLNIQGTSESRVTLTSTSQVAGSWSGVNIGNDSTINYANIEYAYSGVSAIGGLVTNSKIHNNVRGVYVNAGSPQIGPGNIITANYQGVFVQGHFDTSNDPSTNPQPIVAGNQIYNNPDADNSKNNNYSTRYFIDAESTVLDATNNWWGTTSPDDINNTTLSYTNTNYRECKPNCIFITSPQIDFGGYLDAPTGSPVNPNHFFYSISEDVTLVPNTTYELINQVLVPFGVTLNIPAGVKFDNRGQLSRLDIDGTLIAEGTYDNPVIFTSTHVSTLTQSAHYRWEGIWIRNSGTARFNYTSFEYSNLISFQGTIQDDGNCQIQCVENSQIINGSQGIGLGSTVTVRNNLFHGNYSRGINVFSGSSWILSNLFINNGTGIYLSNSATPVINEGNVITNNTYGIYSGATAAPLINNNSIYNNTRYNYYTEAYSGTALGPIILNARNNWWGSSDIGTIRAKLYDYTDNNSRPIVDYSGYLLSDNGQPSNSNNISAITENTTLYANNTYNALGSLYIPAGITLTVQSGAIIQFPKSVTRNAKLLVDGSLIVEQGATPAIFTSTTHTRGDWSGIEITSSATKATIEGVVIQYANRGIYFNGATQQDTACDLFCVRNSIITNNNYGVYLSGAAKPFITGNRIINNSTWGIYLSGSSNDAYCPNPSITNNDIYANYWYFGGFYNGRGLYISNYSSATAITINATENWWGQSPPTQAFGSSGYSDIHISSSSTPVSVVDYSNASVQALYQPITPPTISLATDATTYDAPAAIVLNVTADVANGTISVVDFYNDSTWIGSATSATNNVYSFTWNNVQPGTYILKAIATSSYGGSTTSSNRTVNVQGDVPLSIAMVNPISSSTFYANAMVPMNVNIDSTNSQRTVTRVSYYNGATLLGESTIYPYGYTWVDVPAGAYSIHAVLTDNTGDTTASTPVSISVDPISLNIDGTINNATINDDHMLVSGTFNAPPNTGVTVNNLQAIIFKNTDGSYSYYANNVPLSLGSNTITVRLVSQYGQTAATSVTVISTGSPGFKITADRVFDIQPNSLITFEYKNTSGQVASAIEVDTTGDGTFNPPFPVVANTMQFTVPYSGYSSVRRWPVTINVLDANNNVLYTTTQVIIISTQAAQDALIKSVITSMFSYLGERNTTAALQAFSKQSRSNYSSIFDVLMPYMSTISTELSNAKPINTDINTASYGILRAENGVNKVYIINAMKDGDGVWRIDSM